MMRVSIRFSSLDAPSQSAPVSARSLKMRPGGAPAPIFSLMRWTPGGVLNEFSRMPVPKRDVDAAYLSIMLSPRQTKRACASTDWTR